jgi:beta-N-acetylhexosaminidase
MALHALTFGLAALMALSALPAAAQSIDEMAGQMIVVGFTGSAPGSRAVKAVADEIAAGDIGGVMYLKTNVSSRANVVAMNSAFRAAAGRLPPFIAIDQEGGSVERLTRSVGFGEIPSAASIGARVAVAEARPLFDAQAKGLADWGFNVNFAPVVDLAINPRNPVIARFGRAFASGANTVVAYAEQAVAAHHAAGLLTSLKHFPGHGSSSRDTHEGVVDITDGWEERELEPYRAFIAQGYADFVMVGHLVNKNVSDLPASLSPEWITGVLRNQMGYRGVVISDDLQMAAIRNSFSMRDTVRRAVMAGMDVLLFSNTVKARASLGDEIRAIIVEEAAADPAFRNRVVESYKRIAALKGRIG